MIAEAAYYLAQKRGFIGEHSLEDWLAAEQQVRQVISPVGSEVTMKDTSRQNEPEPDAKALKATEKAHRDDTSPQSKPGQATRQPQSISRFEKFAATQAAGDGVQGDARKPDKTTDEKLGANMADRK
jgi:Protein of unknown function (DUF2934)